MLQLYIPLEYYIAAFRSLNCARRGNTCAPHKPVLLIAVMLCVKEGFIQDRMIEPSYKLEEVFKTVWSKMVPMASPWKSSFNLPFFHMDYEPFWNLIPAEFFVKQAEYSTTQLRRNFRYALIHDDLFSYMKDAVSRTTLIQTLTDYYGLIPLEQV